MYTKCKILNKCELIFLMIKYTGLKCIARFTSSILHNTQSFDIAKVAIPGCFCGCEGIKSPCFVVVVWVHTFE